MFDNTIKQNIPDPAYGNEVWRARHHYKEEHVHDPPLRRNRDFKPVGFGTFRGMPNFKHAEPFALLKNLKDLPNEHHNHPIKWAKAFLFGGFAGAVFGYSWFIFRPF
jgi:hypothetical protein